MPDRPDITPEELATALEVFLQTGSYSEAARAIKRSVNGTRSALLRHPVEAVRGKVYARALERSCATVATAVTRTARQLRQDAKGTAKVAERTNAAFALNDAARTLNTMRVAHAKLVGTHAPEKIEHALHDARSELSAAIARAASGARPDDAGEGDRGPEPGRGGDAPP